MEGQGVKVVSVTFINKETGEIVLSLDQAEIEGQLFSYLKQGAGLNDSDSCEGVDDDLNGGQGK